MHDYRGQAVAVAGAVVIFLMILGGLIVVLGWIGLSIYALVKAIGSAPQTANATVVVLLFLGLVSAFTVLLAALLALVGRAMTPRSQRSRKKRAEAEQVALELEP